MTEKCESHTSSSLDMRKVGGRLYCVCTVLVYYCIETQQQVTPTSKLINKSDYEQLAHWVLQLFRGSVGWDFMASLLLKRSLCVGDCGLSSERSLLLDAIGFNATGSSTRATIPKQQIVSIGNQLCKTSRQIWLSSKLVHVAITVWKWHSLIQLNVSYELCMQAVSLEDV